MSTNHLFYTTHVFHRGIEFHCMSITEHAYLFCCYWTFCLVLCFDFFFIISNAWINILYNSCCTYARVSQEYKASGKIIWLSVLHMLICWYQNISKWVCLSNRWALTNVLHCWTVIFFFTLVGIKSYWLYSLVQQIFDECILYTKH